MPESVPESVPGSPSSCGAGSVQGGRWDRDPAWRFLREVKMLGLSGSGKRPDWCPNKLEHSVSVWFSEWQASFFNRNNEIFLVGKWDLGNAVCCQKLSRWELPGQPRCSGEPLCHHSRGGGRGRERRCWGSPWGSLQGFVKGCLGGEKKKEIREIYFEGFLVKFSMEFCNVG